MSAPKPHNLSSRELLARIGLNEDTQTTLIQDESLDDLLHDLDGDLASVLRERYALLKRGHVFNEGDLVCWKPGLRNRRHPAYGTPAIVLEVLEQPIFDSEQESGSTYFREPFDLVLGLIWNERPARGEFLAFHANSARFQPWTQEA